MSDTREDLPLPPAQPAQPVPTDTTVPTVPKRVRKSTPPFDQKLFIEAIRRSNLAIQKNPHEPPSIEIIYARFLDSKKRLKRGDFTPTPATVEQKRANLIYIKQNRENNLLAKRSLERESTPEPPAATQAAPPDPQVQQAQQVDYALLKTIMLTTVTVGVGVVVCILFICLILISFGLVEHVTDLVASTVRAEVAKQLDYRRLSAVNVSSIST